MQTLSLRHDAAAAQSADLRHATGEISLRRATFGDGAAPRPARRRAAARRRPAARRSVRPHAGDRRAVARPRVRRRAHAGPAPAARRVSPARAPIPPLRAMILRSWRRVSRAAGPSVAAPSSRSSTPRWPMPPRGGRPWHSSPASPAWGSRGCFGARSAGAGARRARGVRRLRRARRRRAASLLLCDGGCSCRRGGARIVVQSRRSVCAGTDESQVVGCVGGSVVGGLRWASVTTC